jgi:release factor glutamine methyltransferase
MKSIKEKIIEAGLILQAAGIDEARRDARMLLAFALGKNQAYLITYDERTLSPDEERLFDTYIYRRSKREPLQHITQNQEFFGLDFYVSRRVLIPRPESELIVENALQILPENGRFCEVGIGSGCISIAILHEAETTSAIGLDISEDAISIAAKNASKHQVANRLAIRHSNLFEALGDEKFEVICSNPPYISLDEMNGLQPEVIDYEPRSALTDGGDGLSIIKKLIAESPRYLKPRGFLLMEIGFGQAEKIRGLISDDIWHSFNILPDLQGIPRMVKLQLK